MTETIKYCCDKLSDELSEAEREMKEYRIFTHGVQHG